MGTLKISGAFPAFSGPCSRNHLRLLHGEKDSLFWCVPRTGSRRTKCRGGDVIVSTPNPDVITLTSDLYESTKVHRIKTRPVLESF